MISKRFAEAACLIIPPQELIALPLFVLIPSSGWLLLVTSPLRLWSKQDGSVELSWAEVLVPGSLGGNHWK